MPALSLETFAFLRLAAFAGVVTDALWSILLYRRPFQLSRTVLQNGSRPWPAGSTGTGAAKTSGSGGAFFSPASPSRPVAASERYWARCPP